MTNPHTTYRMSVIRSEVARTLAAFAKAREALDKMKEARG